MMPVGVIAALSGLGIFLAAYSGWVIRGWKADSEQLIAVNQANFGKEKLALKVESSAEALELLRAEHDQASVETRTTIREIYRDVKVPTECAVPATAAGVLDRAIDRANSEASGELSRPLP